MKTKCLQHISNNEIRDMECYESLTESHIRRLTSDLQSRTKMHKQKQIYIKNRNFINTALI